MFLITIYALFAEDFKLLFFGKSADSVFYLLTSISLILFLIELIISSIAKDEYFNSFFFWLDLISTLSLVTDIKPVLDFITGASTEDESEGGELGQAEDAASLARASRGARIGTRAGRMTRVIRLIRLIRVVKLYKSANQAIAREEKKNEKNIVINPHELVHHSNTQNEDIDYRELLAQDQVKESKVGKKLSDKTTKRVIVMVLVMLFSVPIFTVTEYVDTPTSFMYGLSLMYDLGVDT